jgi:hypothetical protein
MWVVQMRYAMPNPELRKGNYYLRLHVPKDVAQKAKGTTVAIPVGDAIMYRKVGSVVKVSLQTKFAAEAKQRFTKALAAVEAYWNSLRRGPANRILDRADRILTLEDGRISKVEDRT